MLPPIEGGIIFKNGGYVMSDAIYLIQLSYNNLEDRFLIPVLPESIEVKEEGQGKTYNIIGKGGRTEETRAGEINVIKSPKLREVSFSSLFPAQWAPYVYVKPDVLKKPFEYIDLIRKWMATKRPIRFICVGGRFQVDFNADLNFPASIESFEWKEVAGSPGDIEYTIHLKEYVFYAARQLVPITNAAGEEVLTPKSPVRPDERIRPETYTLVPGDTLIKVAMKFYQKDGFPDSSRYKDIQELNGISDYESTRLMPGRVIKLPPQ
jgi:hypothetical protein